MISLAVGGEPIPIIEMSVVILIIGVAMTIGWVGLLYR
ncbi:MAG: hypothetical protein J07HQX50_01849 [Haloquadratum sp. J07HQX50]|nr:MAG: hypothetical protein J07HQX50_01849 [Haloquadratum sp. J07HQX50]